MRLELVHKVNSAWIFRKTSLENLAVVPFRGQKADPDRPDEVEPGGWELLEVSAGGRVHGGSVGSGSDAEEADAGEVSERGEPRRH